MSAIVERNRVVFRRAEVADVAAIVALVESAYRGESSRQGWTTEADLLDGRRTNAEEVRQAVMRPASMLLLAGHDGLVVACAHVEHLGEAGYFGMFSVDPVRQGSGIGRAVLNEAERIARDEWHCDEMHMTVITIRDELIAWYERCGYRRSGQYKPFPYGDERFGIPKRDDLRFEILCKRLTPPL